MPEIVKCLTSADVETVRYALRTLCNLSFNGNVSQLPQIINYVVEDNELEMIRIGTFELVVACLSSRDSDTLRSALSILVRLVLIGMLSFLYIYWIV